MKKHFLSTESLREVDILNELRQLLNQTIETEGPYLWSKLFQEKTASGTPSTQVAVSFEEAKASFEYFLKEMNHKGLKPKINLVLKLGAQSTALFSSALLGLILPQNNVILFKKDQKQDAITLQRASLFISELFLDWMDQILSRTTEKTNQIENPRLKTEIQKHLGITRDIILKSRAGLKRGAGLRFKTSQIFSKLSPKSQRDILIPLEGRAFIALESFLNQTLKTK
ncbi:MAG: hypothetical protein ACKOA8_16535 [Deltaproteobacteria bacterium]